MFTHSSPSLNNSSIQQQFAKVVVNDATGQHALLAAIFFEKGSVITEFSAREIYAVPDYLTIQVNDEQHISLSPECLQYTNHSCEPNVFFDTTDMQMIALQDIQPGDELQFFYPSTEFQMAQPFACHCQSKKCLGSISGAVNLTKIELQEYRLTDFIKKKLSIS